MAAGATLKNVNQRVLRVNIITFRFRLCLGLLLTISLIGFVASHQRLSSPLDLMRSAPFINGSTRIGHSNLTILEYSAKNPEGTEERRKIQQLLTKSENGTLSIKEVFSRKSFTIVKTFFSRGRKRILTTRDTDWMTPLMRIKFTPFVPKFYELAKKWLGDGESDRSVMHSLVESVKESLDRHAVLYNSSRKPSTERWERYRSCAVVGNSGILLSRSYGAQIDSHDVVIRLNNANVLKYKEHAAHLMDVAYCSPRYEAAVVVTESKLDALCARIAKWYSVQHFVEVTGKGIYEWDSVHHDLYFHYSSGMQAVVLALGICDSIEIFGFGKARGTKHHYHTNQKKELGVHDYDAEYIFYDDLINNRTIPFLSDAGISIPPVRIFFDTVRRRRNRGCSTSANWSLW